MINTIKKFFSDINFFFTKRLKYLFAINFISGFLVSFFEIIGLGVIFYYIGIITDPINYLSKYPNLDIFNYILSLDDNSRVIFMSIILVVVFWSKALMIFFLNYFQAKFYFEFINYTSTELFKKYIYKNYYFHIKNNPAILNQRIHNDSNHVGMYFDWSLKFIHSLLFILTILIIFLYNSSSAGIVGIVLVGLIIFLFRFFLIGKIKKRSEYRAINDIELFKTMQHSFGSFIETILFKKQNFFINIFSKYLKEREFQTFYLNIINCLPKIFIEAFFVLGVAMFFSLFYGSSLDLLKILPSIVLMILCLFRLMPNLSIFLLSINQIKFLSVAKNSIAKELKSLENNIINEDTKKLKKKIVFNKNIEIKNVYFKYEENSTDDVLKNVNLTINFGEKIAIVGNSGSGKSTLINLLTGLLRPDSGSILVDDVPIFENIEQWQSIISYIPQEIYLIDDTIEKNITFSSDNEQSDRSWLNHILLISNLYDEVYALKDNINTYVGNRGIKFSGGQKQRIAIARALYKKPKILIMDEPTSGLDFYNELSLIENIISISRDITLVMISHSIERHKGKFKVYELNQNNLIKRP